MNHNDFLIQKKYKLTPFQQRVFIYMLTQLSAKNTPTPVAMKARDMMEGLFPKLNYDDIKEETRKLLSKNFEIDETNRLLQVSILSSIAFLKGQGIIQATFTPALIPYLLALKQAYSIITIRNIINFKSTYSSKIYLKLLSAPRGEAVKISVAHLKEYLNISYQYNDYNTFKNRVILQAQKELHHTALAFTFKEVKEGRKITAFILKTKKLKQLNLSDKEERLVQKLCREMEVTYLQAKKIVIEFVEEEIYTTIYNIKERYRTGQIKSSLGAYTVGVFNKMIK